MNLKNIILEEIEKFINESIDIEGLYLTDTEVNDIMKGYLEAALWTEEERLKDDYNEMQPKSVYDDDIEDDDDDEIDKLIQMKNKLETKQFTSFVTEDIDVNSKIQAYLDIKNFITTAGADAIIEAIQENGEFKLGMDFWLTRNRHGAGFGDYYYENVKILKDTAQSLKEVDLYIGDDNKLYFSNAN